MTTKKGIFHEKWFQILVEIVGVALITFAGWIAYQVYEIKGTLGYHTGRIDETSKRVDRIVDAVSDMKIKIAEEEMARPIEAALIITKPVRLKTGEEALALHILNGSELKRHIYLIKNNELDEDELSSFLIGKVQKFDPKAISLSKLEEITTDAKKPIIFPRYIEKTASFIITKHPDKLEKNLIAKTNKVLKISGKAETCKYKSIYLKTLAKDLRENPSLYQVSDAGKIYCPPN